MTTIEPEPTQATSQLSDERGGAVGAVSLYQNTVVHPDDDLLVHYLAIPARALPAGLRETLASENPILQLAPRLGLKYTPNWTSGSAVGSFLPLYIAAVLAGADLDTVEGRLNEMLNGPQLAVFEGLDPKLVHFAHYAAYAELVPFEMSKVDFHSLGSISVLTAAATTGSSIGVVASGGTPLILLTVPLGIVLVGVSLVAIVAAATAVERLVQPPSGGNKKGTHDTI